MGSDNTNNPAEINNTLLITGDNFTLQNAILDYSAYIQGNNDTLDNVNIKGTLFIDPGEKGTLNLDKVSASQIVVLSGVQDGIQLKDVKADTFKIVSPNKINIAPTGNSIISNAFVYSDSIIDATQGTWGSVHIMRAISPETAIELKETFNHDIFVTSAGTLKADANATVNKVIVMPQDKGLITLDGTFNVVQIESPAQLSLAATAVVNNLVTHAKTDLNVEKGAVVGHLYNGDFSVLAGDGAQDLPTVDMNDPYPVLNPEGYQTKNPAIKITAPQDGAVLDYGNVTVTWTPVSGATGYWIDVNDLDNPWRYLADYTVSNIPAGTQSLTLTKDRITTRHHYVITV